MRNITIRGKTVPTVLLAMLLVLSGLGAAAGTTFEGSVEGDVVSKVDQSIIIQSIDAPAEQTNNHLGKVSDDGTQFRFAANVNQGDLYHVYLILDNKGTQDLNGVLRLDVPEPIEIEAASKRTKPANLALARTSRRAWNFNIEPPENVTENTTAGQAIYRTKEPVADRDNDGDIDADDITFHNAPGQFDEDIATVVVNADGTATITVNTAANGKFEGNDQITYKTAARIDVLIAIPDDANPGFYTLEGSISPAEV